MDTVCRIRLFFGSSVTRWLCLIICVGLFASNVKCADDTFTIIEPTAEVPESTTPPTNRNDASGGTTEASNVTGTDNTVTGGTEASTTTSAGATEEVTGATDGTEEATGATASIEEATTTSAAAADNTVTGGTEASSTTSGATEEVTGATDGTEEATGATDSTEEVTTTSAGATDGIEEATTTSMGATDGTEEATGATDSTEEVTTISATTTKKPVTATETIKITTDKPSTEAVTASTTDTTEFGKTEAASDIETTAESIANSTIPSGNATFPPPLSPVAIANVTAQNVTYNSVSIFWEQIDDGNNQTYRLVGYMLSPTKIVESKIVDFYINATSQSGRHRLTQGNLSHHTLYMFCVIPEEISMNEEGHLEITDASITSNTTDCFTFRTPYNPLNPKAVAAFGCAGLIVIIFFATVITAKLYEKSKDEEAEEKMFLVDQLKWTKRLKRKHNYGSDKTLLSGYAIMDDEVSDYEQISLDAKATAKDRHGNYVEVDKMSMPDDSSDTGYLLDGQ